MKVSVVRNARPLNLDRIVVVGTSGAGKSTFARRVANLKGSTFVELDALFWNPEWRQTDPDEFAARVAAVSSSARWVLDGNYAAVRPLIWSRASCLIWLNYPLRISFARLLRRTLRRGYSGEACCNGNREELSKAFFSKDSILLWAVTHHPGYKREYPKEFESYPHLEVVELRHPTEAEDFISSLEHAV